MPRKASPPPAASPAAPAYTALVLTHRNEVALVGLNRPQVRNAFDETLIAELTACFAALDADPRVRVVVVYGEGEAFCAGGDLNWMRRMAAFGYEENLADAGALARMYQTLHRLSKPTIACVQGAAFGGGVGLVACCDIAIAATDATFALSEARLGLIPATIGPYVVAAIGARQAHRYFLTAERFTAAEAYRIGLVHELAQPGELDAKVNEMLGELLVAGPHAQAAAKALIRAVAGRPIDEKVILDTAERIAVARASDEGREGVAAFLTKRSPAWVPEALRPPKKRG
jgi:methylglutaconyl-CoA hydratase